MTSPKKTTFNVYPNYLEMKLINVNREGFIEKNIEDWHDLANNESLELCGGIKFFKITRTLNEIIRRNLHLLLHPLEKNALHNVQVTKLVEKRKLSRNEKEKKLHVSL